MLFDQNVLRPLGRFLAPHSVQRAAELGWEELKNGLLLAAAEDAGFDVLLSGDRTIRYEQNMARRRIALVCMSDNRWPIVKGRVAAILEAILQAAPGAVRTVFCASSPSGFQSVRFGSPIPGAQTFLPDFPGPQ